jgi:glycosyltransferase A (GT-A) superfamily protein (DUF2064 family)
MRPAVIVIAKAPVPGLAKTRLAADVGADAAADVAAAALLDTLEAAGRWAAPDRRLAVLTGDLGLAARGCDIAARLATWHIATQPDLDFARRIAAAFRSGMKLWGRAPSALIGMDTPQVTPHDLDALADELRTAHPPAASVGPADDGGWWGLALSDPATSDAIADAPMSTNRTCALTVGALTAAGVSVRLAGRLRDVDTAADALSVAASAPRLRLAQVVRALPSGAL